MKLYFILLSPLALTSFILFIIGNFLNTLPLDDNLTYGALQGQLRRPEMIGQHVLNLDPAKMIERNGEAILVGKGSTRYTTSREADVPVLEDLNFEYIMIISRECHDPDTKCYKAHQVEVTAEKYSLPLI